MPKKELTFEQSLTRLEEIVAQLERGEQSLEESLTLFEEGTKRIKQCSALLEKAEQKVVKLTQDAEGQLMEVPFPDGGENP
jgi:exodeoxyribonuclease VII small subunit